MATKAVRRTQATKRTIQLTTGELIQLRAALIEKILKVDAFYPRDRLMNHDIVAALYWVNGALPEDV